MNTAESPAELAPTKSEFNNDQSLLSTSMEIGLQVEGIFGMIIASIVLYYAIDAIFSKRKEYIEVDATVSSISIEKNKVNLRNDALTYMMKYSVIATVTYSHEGTNYVSKCNLATVESEIEAHEIKNQHSGKTIKVWAEVNRIQKDRSEESDTEIVGSPAFLNKPRSNTNIGMILSLVALLMGGLSLFKYKYRKNDYAQTANAFGLL